MNKTLKEKIEEIVNHIYDCKRVHTPSSEHMKIHYRKLLSLFEEMGESLIGKDEEMTGDLAKLHRNKLREEQEAKLKELLGK